MKKLLLLSVITLVLATMGVAGPLDPDTLGSNFSLPASACVNQHVEIVYDGNAPANATYTWDFDGGIVLSGSGQGPYVVKWETVGMKAVMLTVHWELQTSTTTKEIHIVPLPEIFEMTGGGVYIPGGAPVPVGLSGSQQNIIYKLRKNAVYTGINIVGNGSPISFGAFTEAGSYSAVAKVDGADCLEEMAGDAVITTEVPQQQAICMVSFDPPSQKNMIVWNKVEGPGLSHFNIYKETFVNGTFEKIAEVAYNNFSVYIDSNSYPLVKSDRYRISVSDSNGHEFEKSPHHKTIHLNISTGIYGFNLIWNHYEGYEFLTYRIFRQPLGVGTFELLASVASNVDSYTDFYTQPGIMTYYIEAVRMEACNPSLKDNGYIAAVSNYATAAPLGVSNAQGSNVLLYPNPVNDMLNIDLKESLQGAVTMKVVSTEGQLLLQQELTGTRSQVSLSGITPGLYFVQLEGKDISLVRKIVKR
jgi:hypothetical protein